MALQLGLLQCLPRSLLTLEQVALRRQPHNIGAAPPFTAGAFLHSVGGGGASSTGALPVSGAEGAACSGTASLWEDHCDTLVLPLQVAPQVQDDFDLPEEGLQEVDPRNREENQVGAHVHFTLLQSQASCRDVTLLHVNAPASVQSSPAVMTTVQGVRQAALWGGNLGLSCAGHIHT